MELGSEIGEVTRGLLLRRIAWEWIAALCALGFLFIAVGTSVSLFDPGYVFGEGELPGEVGVLVGTAALAIVALSRIWAGDRRAEALLADLGAGKWLPSRETREDETGAAFQEETARLRTLGRRAVLIAVLWGWVLAACFAGLMAADRPSGAGPQTGVRTLGDVVGVGNAPGGVPSIRVEYRVDGKTRTAEIVQGSAGAHTVGQVVAVVYDPAHPQNAAIAVDERSGDGFPIGILVVPLLVALVAVPWSLLAAFRWRRRYLAVRRTGWYRAAVTVLPEQSRRAWRPDIHVRYPDGSVIALCAVPAIDRMRKLADRPNRRAWIGGWGRDMVVLFPPGPLGARSHAIPAYSIAPREDG